MVPPAAKARVTAIVANLSADGLPGKDAVDALVSHLYPELRRLAQWRLGQAAGQTLQATALVHEVYLKLVDHSQVDWQGRSHFMAVAGKVMRNVLIDHFRERAAQKRGGDVQRVTFSQDVGPGAELDLDQLLGLDQALTRLAERDPRQAQVVEMRFFGGLSVEEVAAALHVSKRAAEGHWTHARAWLQRELSREAGA